MGARAGRRFLLAPTRPVQVRPSSRYIAPLQAYGSGTFTFGGASGPTDLSYLFDGGDPTFFALTGAVRVSVDVAVTSPPANLRVRQGLSVEVDMPDPAIVGGKPVLPGQGWMRGATSFNVRSVDTSYTVTKPPPPVPAILTRPENDNLTTPYVWMAEDLGAAGSSITTWPEADGGPSFTSAGSYRPNVGGKSILTSRGRYVVYDKMAVFNYRRVEHMWVDIGANLAGPFSWVMCGIILSYPTARYGHYLLDHGGNPGSNGTNYGFVKRVGGESGHRSAMLFQKRSALVGTTFPTIEVGPYARSPHNYTPQPRVFWGIFNGSSSYVGVRGRNYRHQGKGRVLPKTHRKFVVGRRNGYTSTDLASHIALFEIRFYPDALSKAALGRIYSALQKKYDFAKYRI